MSFKESRAFKLITESRDCFMGRPTSPRTIDSFEKSINRTLPASLQEFYQCFNGGTVLLGTMMFELDGEEMRESRRYFARVIPEGSVVVGQFSTGDPIVLRKDDRLAIVALSSGDIVESFDNIEELIEETFEILGDLF